MWFTMAKLQEHHNLSERLIRSISNWETFTGGNDDIEYLLDIGANVNCTHGMLMPLHCASMVCDVEVMKLLIDRGADVNAIDGYGRAPIHYAAEKDVDCTQLLLDNSANPNTQDGNNARAIHWASFKNNYECVETLLSYGADINALDFNNNTPLSWASQKCNLATIRVLLDFNADVSLKNYNLETALSRCASIQALGLSTDGDDACIDILVKASGNLNFHLSNTKLSDSLILLNKSPRKLHDLCRFIIRQSIGPCYLVQSVARLPIPTRLKDYLLLRM